MIDKAITLLNIVKKHLENNLPLCPFPQRDIIYSVFLNNGALKEEFITAFPIEKASDFHRTILIMGMANSSSGFAPNDEVGSMGYGYLSRKALIEKLDEILYELNRSNSKVNFEDIYTNDDDNYDLFISHASEDKDALARPLAKMLLKLGYSVFLDELVIKLGDSITKSINQGLAKAKYCIIIISNTFLEKNWTKAELNSITNMYISSDKKILPIWHGVTYEDIVSNVPLLVDLKAVDSKKSIDFLVNEITQSIGKPAKERPSKTNYLWNFFDFSESVQLSILKHLIESLTDVDLQDYHSALEEVTIFMDSLCIHKMSDVLANEYEKVRKEVDNLLLADIEDLENGR